VDMSWIYDEYTIEFNNSWNGYKEHGPEHGRYFHECSGVKKWGSSMFFLWSRGDSGDLDTNGLHGNTIWL
jgi:hypothetical protein